MKRLALISAVLLAAPLAFGACRDDPTAPEGSAFNDIRPIGDIQVSVITGGSGEAEAGMSVTLDGGPAQSIRPGQAHVFADVSVGQHMVQLRNVDERCLAEGSSSRQVTVRAGQTESVYFFVRCNADRPWKPQT